MSPVRMRATATFQFRGRVVMRGEQLFVAPDEAAAKLRSGHAVVVDAGDLRHLAAAAGIEFRPRRVRGHIGAQT